MKHTPFKLGGYIITPPDEFRESDYARVYRRVQMYGPALLDGRIEDANWWADRAAITALKAGWSVVATDTTAYDKE